MQMSPKEFSEAQTRRITATAAIIDLLLGLLAGALAVILGRDLGSNSRGWLAISVTVSTGTAALLLVLGGALLLRRIAWAGHVAEAGIGLLVVVFDASAFIAAVSCEELGCVVVPFAFVIALIVTLVGILIRGLNLRARRNLSE